MTRQVLAGLALIASFIIAVQWAVDCYDEPDRLDGNYGHATIDFGGQWLMGRMLVTGNARRLYDRIALRRVVAEAYPLHDSEPARGTANRANSATGQEGQAADTSSEQPRGKRNDTDQLLDWLAGDDRTENSDKLSGYLIGLAGHDSIGEACLLTAGHETWHEVGGALYPPINAYLYAPLGLLQPRPAYRAMQVFNVALVFAIAFLVQRLTGGRIWWQIAAILLMGFPGFSGAFNLAQNSLISVFLLIFGWRQVQQGRTGLAGFIWGFMAFKPVWAASFFLVPLWTRRWRMAIAMAVTGAALSASTLPVVGVQGWKDWLAVGSEASRTYATCETWIFLSRDLIGIPRRYLLTFKDDYAASDDPRTWLASTIGLGLWITPLTVTTAAVLRRGRPITRVTSGPQAAFPLLGAWLVCYHFMYYDVLLAYLPCCLLYAEPRRVCRRILHGMPPGTWWGLARSALATVLLICLSLVPYICSIQDATYHFPPWDTFILVTLWLWCDFAHGQVSVRSPQVSDGDGGVGRAHQSLADQNGADLAGEQSFHVGSTTNATLTDQGDPRRYGGGDFEGMLEPRNESP